MTIGDPAAVQVVGRNFEAHPIAGQHPDPVLPHLAGHLGEDAVVLADGDLVVAVAEVLLDGAFELDGFFFLDDVSPSGRS